MTNETKLNGDTEESLALLLRGEANDELKACVPTEEEERRGLVAASGSRVYCIEEGRKAIPAVKLGKDITSLVYSSRTLFAACDGWNFNSGEIVDVSRRKPVAEGVVCYQLIPFQDSIAGVTRDGKIMDFGRGKKIADADYKTFSPLCSDGNSLFHADKQGVVYDTLEHRAIGKLEERAWCLHPHNDDILAGTFGKIVSVKDNRVIGTIPDFRGPVTEICTEGDRIFYLTMCDGAVQEVTGHKRLLTLYATRILADKGKLYAGRQDGKVMIRPLDGPADGRMEVKAVSEIGYGFSKPITAMAMVPMSLWEELAANNGRGI